jgi:hypothetical protein
MKLSHFDRFRIDPANWRLGFLYFAKEDPRLVVRKRIAGMGFTLNFARPLAPPLLLIIIAIAATPLEALVGGRFQALVPAGKVLAILGLTVAANRLPSHPR